MDESTLLYVIKANSYAIGLITIEKRTMTSAARSNLDTNVQRPGDIEVTTGFSEVDNLHKSSFSTYHALKAGN
jgi:hypothetical protein